MSNEHESSAMEGGVPSATARPCLAVAAVCQDRRWQILCVSTVYRRQDLVLEFSTNDDLPQSADCGSNDQDPSVGYFQSFDILLTDTQ